MAGRAAEELIFGEISTGAADDLARATDIARQIVTRFGMIKELGQAVFERQGQSYLGDNVVGMRQKDYSEETAREDRHRGQAPDRWGLCPGQEDSNVTAQGPGGGNEDPAGKGNDHAGGLPALVAGDGKVGSRSRGQKSRFSTKKPKSEVSTVMLKMVKVQFTRS